MTGHRKQLLLLYSVLISSFLLLLFPHAVLLAQPVAVGSFWLNHTDFGHAVFLNASNSNDNLPQPQTLILWPIDTESPSEDLGIWFNISIGSFIEKDQAGAVVELIPFPQQGIYSRQ